MSASFCSDIFFPKRCASCSRLIEVGSDETFCKECAETLISDTRVDDRPPFKRIVSAFIYADAAAEVVRNMKHDYIPGTVDFAADRVYERIITETDGAFDLVTFVPRYGKKIPYSSSMEMAKRISKRLNVPLGTKTVIKVRNIKSQTGCRSDKERRRNVSNAFRVCGDVSGKRVLVIDDVMTTGSTLREIGRILSAAGAEPFGAVFARTDLSYSSKKLVPVRAVPQIYTFGNRSDIPFSDYDRAVKRLRRGRKFRRLKSKAAEAIRKKFGLQQKA